MKNVEVIKINGDESDVLSVTLKDILKNIHEGQKYKWSILWLEASGNLGSMSILDFEKEIKEAERGYLISWYDLLELSEKFYQVIDLTLVGAKTVNRIRRYSDDKEMYLCCDFTVELIDSSYWIIHSNDILSIDKMRNNLAGVDNI